MKILNSSGCESYRFNTCEMRLCNAAQNETHIKLVMLIVDPVQPIFIAQPESSNASQITKDFPCWTDSKCSPCVLG
jgi:hypothetical protein